MMKDLKVLDREIFSCSVPLDGANKMYLIDGKTVGNDNLFIKKGEKEYNIDLSAEEFLQLICVRETPILECNYELNIFAKGHSTLVLCSHTIGNERFTTNETINITIQKGASLDIIVMQNENGMSNHQTHFNIDQGSDSHFKLNIITLFGGIVKNSVDGAINGKGSASEIYGLYLGSGNQQISNSIKMLHRQEQCTSNQLFKGILDDFSTANFNGQIVVEKGAQKTEAYQANNNLLISQSSKVQSKPELIIYADDVKCSHGSTIGTIGEDELFYLRSRGISLKEAQILRQQAFAAAILEKISKDQLRDRLSNLVERRLRGEAIHCQSCYHRCC